MTEPTKIQTYMFNDIVGKYVSGKLYDFLVERDFFGVPASLSYHGSFSGGLFVHSVMVTNFLLIYTERLKLRWKNERSPFIVGMFHDLCKTNDYIRRAADDNSPKSTDGKWVKNPDKLSGHGEKSIQMLSEFIELTDEERECIRFHMGAFCNSEEWGEYTAAVEKFTNVLYTHTADMAAAHIMGT